jgi:hypothetical protein
MPLHRQFQGVDKEAMVSPSDPDLIQKKVCNAFYTDEQLAKLGYSSGELGLELVRLFMKGLWLGGTVYLTPTQLIFELNALNKLFHSGNYRVEISLAEISQVTVKPTFGYKIIQLNIPQGDFRIRVSGAKDFAALIEATRAKTTSTDSTVNAHSA